MTWLRFAEQFGDRLLYGDTDSVYSMDPASPDSDIGPLLGQFAYDGPMERFDCIGPKAYRYYDVKESKWVTRLKGVPDISPEEWERFRQGESIVNERGVMGLRSAGKRSKPDDDTIFRRKVIKRSDQSDGLWFGDRRLKRNSTITEPVTYAEQCRRER